LRQSPVEPLSFASLENLTLEVAFEADGSMSLYFLPEFQAKDQRPSDRSPFVIIRFLVNLASPEEPDFLNCPVRSLRYYRRRLSDIVYNTVLRADGRAARIRESYLFL
jgi:hypothetical protein